MIMRIGILTHGNNMFGRHYARVFSQRGHEVILFFLSRRQVDTSVYEMYDLSPPGFNPAADTARTPYARTILPVRRAVRGAGPDILFALYMSSAGVVACLRGHPHVVVSARGTDVNGHIGSRIWRAVFRWQGRRCDLVHAVSHPLADKLQGAGVDPGKLIVCPIGVDTQRLGLIDPAARPDARRIVTTRAHGPTYDQDTLVRALARLKQRGFDCHVTFASDLRAEPTRQLVRQLGLEDRVTFLGGYRLEELPSVLAAADVFVSCSRSDGTSSSLLEAMSTGTFPVVSDIEANRPWVRHGRNGYLFAVGDDAALADLLADALSNADLRAAAAPLNRQIILERGDVYGQMDKLLEAFRRVLTSRTGRKA